MEKLGELKTAFFDVIKKVVEDGIDMERMESVIHREYLKVSLRDTGAQNLVAHRCFVLSLAFPSCLADWRLARTTRWRSSSSLISSTASLLSSPSI